MYLHLVDFFMGNVGKYTSPMDGMGYITKGGQAELPGTDAYLEPVNVLYL